MTAYKRALGDPDCQEWGCARKATFKVFNSANALVGKFCGPHANQAVDRLNRPSDPRRGRS